MEVHDDKDLPGAVQENFFLGTQVPGVGSSVVWLELHTRTIGAFCLVSQTDWVSLRANVRVISNSLSPGRAVSK